MGTKLKPFEYTGLAIRLLRTRANLNQGELAEAAEITKAQASKYERGRQRPALETLQRILEALGADAFEFATALQEAEIAVAVRQDDAHGVEGAGRARERRRRARVELVREFGRYLELLEGSLEGAGADGSASPSGGT